ncbi:Uncharacterized protein GBIM_18169 [Gryllus bimaculatus]|nr:Uncharacterized protein GBIM_18169 [Gryllus bimaculatus]
MDGIKVMAESLITIKEIKEEPEDFLEEPQPIEVHVPSSLKREVKKEEDDESQEIHKQSSLSREIKEEDDEELEPPATVFLEVKQELREEITEEYEDSFATHREDVSDATEECEELPGEEAKKKWKNLRDTFAKSMRSTQTKTGQAAKSGKKWVWADQMQAFLPYLAFATTTSNVSETDSENVNLNSHSTEENASQSVEIVDEAAGAENVVETDNTEITAKTRSSVISADIPPRILQPVSDIPISAPATDASRRQKLGRKRRSESPSCVSEIIQYFESKQETECDATDCLFLAHAKTVKTFSRQRQAIIKMKIAQLIMEQELLHLEELASTSSTPSHENSTQSYYSNPSAESSEVE